MGSYWPFAIGRRVDQANLLLRQIVSDSELGMPRLGLGRVAEEGSEHAESGATTGPNDDAARCTPSDGNPLRGLGVADLVRRQRDIDW